MVVLKKVTPPAMSGFDEILQGARRQARQTGMKRLDVAAAIRAARAAR